jgi:hypothetical protein
MFTLLLAVFEPLSQGPSTKLQQFCSALAIYQSRPRHRISCGASWFSSVHPNTNSVALVGERTIPTERPRWEVSSCALGLVEDDFNAYYKCTVKSQIKCFRTHVGMDTSLLLVCGNGRKFSTPFSYTLYNLKVTRYKLGYFLASIFLWPFVYKARLTEIILSLSDSINVISMEHTFPKTLNYIIIFLLYLLYTPICWTH